MSKSGPAVGPRSRYVAFGLAIGSEIPLPELGPPVAHDAGPADVDIRIGEVPKALTTPVLVEATLQIAPGELLLRMPEARFLVRDGRAVLVEPAPGASDRDIRSYLLGSVIGAICHQRGLLPLHANAIEVDGRAFAFTGPSGAGKSTLAAYFASQGLRVLCDDVCVISFDATGHPLIWPGVPRIKLWEDSLTMLGLEKEGLERAWDGAEKYSVPAQPLVGKAAGTPIAGVYRLEASEGSPGIRRLSGVEAMNAVFANIYRGEYVNALGVAEATFHHSTAVATRAAVYLVRRGDGGHWGLSGVNNHLARWG